MKSSCEMRKVFFIFPLGTCLLERKLKSEIDWWEDDDDEGRSSPLSLTSSSRFSTIHNCSCENLDSSLTSLDRTCRQRVYCWIIYFFSLLIYLSALECSKFREKAINFYHKWSLSMDKSIGKYFKYGKLFFSALSQSFDLYFVFCGGKKYARSVRKLQHMSELDAELKWKYCMYKFDGKVSIRFNFDIQFSENLSFCFQQTEPKLRQNLMWLKGHAIRSIELAS